MNASVYKRPKKKVVKPEKKKSDKHMIRRKRFGRRMGDHRSGSVWLISFTDVMALMLTFFVLMFAMSNPKESDWMKLTQNVQESFNRFYGKQLNRGNEDAINISKINFSEALDINYLKALMQHLIEQEKSLDVVTLMENSSSLIISLPNDLLFDPSQAQVKQEANKALFTLAGTLSRIKNRIEIVGHTDPRPMRSNVFPSNWELSLTRAINVAAVLENVGYDRPLSARGNASGRFEDIPVSIPVDERLELSRRVDIVIMEDDGKRIQLFDIGMPQL